MPELLTRYCAGLVQQIHQRAPGLLTSRVPPVFLLITSTAWAISEADVTSRLRRMTLGRSERWDILVRERAVAKT